jgi:tetratricopeptide (TPR) repeat protein
LYSIGLFCVLFPAIAIAGDNPDYVNLVRQGRDEYRSGRYAAAETTFVNALRTLGRTDYRERAETLAELGDTYTNEDELSKGENAYAQSLRIYSQLSDRKRITELLRRMGAVYLLEARDDDALRVLERALKSAKADQELRLEVEVLNVLGAVYYRQGNNNNAGKYFNEALKIASDTGIPVNRGELLNNLGNVYQAQHKYEEAEALLMRALAYVENDFGTSHPALTFTLSSLGALYIATGRYADAEAQYRRALAILESSPPAFNTRVARLLRSLSLTYAKAGRKQEADAALERAAAIARKNLNEHTDMAAILEQYSALLKNQGKPKEAEEFRAEARRARIAASLVRTAHPSF